MWIEDYRRKEGLELDEFARRVNRHSRKMNPPLLCTVTDELIYILERDKKSKTHPLIANSIAEVCGATVEQRDSIVAEIHRGTWSPDTQKQVVIPEPKKHVNGAMPVVKVDLHGNIIAYFESVMDAGVQEPHSTDYVRKRCKRRVEYEFTPERPYTYRYESEWREMTPEQRIKDLGVDKYVECTRGNCDQ